MILDNAPEKVHRYNQLCVHYNLVADGIYRARGECENLFGIDFHPFLVAALISFDLGRMMGSGAETRYDPAHGGFAARLMEKLQTVQQYLHHLTNVRLCEVNPVEERENIVRAYRQLSSGGNRSLNQTGDEFHVGATKIMHFLCPELFVIIDSNAARAFRMAHNVNYRNTTQPGYTADKYIECLSHAQADINDFGIAEFCTLENGTPMARIYDKLSFATGANWP
jgi:hypothetical protein